MNKKQKWNEAKQLVRAQLGGAHTTSHYLERLNNMYASKYEDPVKFTEKFKNVFRSAGVTDSVAFGSILMKALSSNHADLVKQIRSAYVSSSPIGRPELDVGYICRTAPLLHVEPRNERKHGRDNMNSQQEHKRHRGENTTSSSISMPASTSSAALSYHAKFN
ncbi:hypothetical protein BC941DRAFT_477484 [Chlamydoabsidia padenii]|nr:hypothetical protein BC941DRAFT_477484 [Chlamydoabsidia padenii]